MPSAGFRRKKKIEKRPQQHQAHFIPSSMAFDRIRYLRSRRRTPSSADVPPSETAEASATVEVGNSMPDAVEAVETTALEEPAIDEPQPTETEAPIKEINIQEEIEWTFPATICNCGLSPNGLLCLTDGLCGIVPSPPETPRRTQPFFLKVNQVDPNETGFMISPMERGVCSISRKVSELEDGCDSQVVVLQQQQEEEELKSDVNESRQSDRNERNAVESLHLQIGPLKNQSHDNQERESQAQQEQIGKAKFSVERIGLPMRAGRQKRDMNANSDDCEVEGQTRLLPTTRSRISRLPVRAGRRTNKLEDEITAPAIHEKPVPRRGFAERRKALIAPTKKEESIIPPQKESQTMDIPLINISHDVSFENKEEFEAAVSVSSDNRNECNTMCNDVCKSAMCRGESSTTKGSLDCTMTSNETLEETFNSDFENSTLEFGMQGISADDRITKAGWITRQLYREGRRDRIDGAQSVELVYTLD